LLKPIKAISQSNKVLRVKHLQSEIKLHFSSNSPSSSSSSASSIHLPSSSPFPSAGDMGNCNTCVRDDVAESNRVKKKKTKPNPYAEEALRSGVPIRVLKDVTSRSLIGDKYVIGRELGRGEFGITYLCTDRETKQELACKSISKRKLRTAVDVEDVRREVAIMSTLPDHANVVKLKATYEDQENVHLVMELCAGGELFDRIVARGHYSERAAAHVARTIAEVVRMCHANGVMHRDLKPENFLFANKKENSVLKAIDFGLSVFFKPGMRVNGFVSLYSNQIGPLWMLWALKTVSCLRCELLVAN